MKKFLTIVFFIAFTTYLKSQNLNVKWSEQFKQENKIDGFFEYYVGANDQYIYAKFANLAFRRKKKNKKLKLIAFDKKTMKKVGEAMVKGYNKDNLDYDYDRTIVFNKSVYVVWTKEAKKKKEFFIQSFDEKLKKLNKLTKIYEISIDKNNREVATILSNTHASKLIILKEFPLTKEEDKLRIEYKILNSDLSFGSAHQVTIPIVFTKKRNWLLSTLNKMFKADYELADDGNLYVQDWVVMDESEKGSLKKGESSVYSYFAQINTQSGNLKDYKVKYNNKNTFRVSYLLEKGKIRLYGFFSDLNKDVKGKDTHGIFYVSLNNNTFKVETTHFEYFDKRFLDELYADDRKDQKKGRGLLKSKQAKKSDEESIDDLYVIEHSISEGNNLTLFCSMMFNYSVERCTNGAVRVCKTYYYCLKKNVTVFKLNGDGKIMWAKNIDRQITYNEWNVFDIKAVVDKSNYYVLYGANRDLKGRKKRGTKAIKNEKIEYAVFSSIDGKYKKAEQELNSKSTKRKEKKYVILDDISIYDNKMYTQSTRIKRKPAIYAALLFLPVYVILNLNGDMYKGTGYAGTMAPSGS